jgi:hypothetical protein
MYARKGAPYLPVGRSFSLGRPLTQHAHTLPNGQPDPRPVPYHGGKNRVRCSQMTAGEQQLNHARPVARPLLDLVEVVLVGVVRIVSFFVRPVSHGRGARVATRKTHTANAKRKPRLMPNVTPEYNLGAFSVRESRASGQLECWPGLLLWWQPARLGSAAVSGRLKTMLEIFCSRLFVTFLIRRPRRQADPSRRSPCARVHRGDGAIRPWPQ